MWYQILIRHFAKVVSFLKNTAVICTICPRTLILAIFFAVVAPTAFAGDIRTERIHFKRGASSAVIKSSIKGYATVDYLLSARKGQYMKIKMKTDNTSNYFNVLVPGEKDMAFFNGSMDQNQYQGVLPKGGDYKVRVYLMRNAARRNGVANYRLQISITNAGDKPNSCSSINRVFWHAKGE